jgi:hypothetical protein
MTARAAFYRGRRLAVSGEGYGAAGTIAAEDGGPAGDMDALLVPAALWSEQITVVLPRVSTAASFLSLSCCVALRGLPWARLTVTTARCSSVLAVAARAMEVSRVSIQG